MNIFDFVDMVDYKWEVYHLEYNNEEEKKVTSIYWRCIGQYEQYSSIREGINSDFSPDGKDFIPYDKLTEDICIEWACFNTYDFNPLKIKAEIAASIKDQMPKEYSVPWGK